MCLLRSWYTEFLINVFINWLRIQNVTMEPAHWHKNFISQFSFGSLQRGLNLCQVASIFHMLLLSPVSLSTSPLAGSFPLLASKLSTQHPCMFDFYLVYRSDQDLKSWLPIECDEDACCHCPWRSGQGRLLHNLVQLRSAATSSTFSGTRTPAGPPAQSCPPRWSSLPASRVDQHQLIWVEMYLHLTYLKTFLVRQDNRH